MDNSNHTSIDIKHLANLLSEKFKTLYPLSKVCSIYRVPLEIRSLNPIVFTPQAVSIGPIHHRKEELKAMEEHKLRYLHCFLRRTKVSIEDFLALIKNKEEKLRSCYAEIIELTSNEFVMMILVDAIFLIEYFLRGSKPHFKTDDDRIFEKPWMDIENDLWLVENQIPLFILDELFKLAETATHNHYGGLSLFTITDSFRKDILYYFQIKEELFKTYFSQATHFLDLLRLCLHHPYQSRPQNKHKPQNIPTLTDLHRAGVKFKLRSNKNLFDITFKKGVLEIPFLTIYEPTELLFRNLQAFERLHCPSGTKYINDYVIIMNYLVNTPKDVELLIKNGVIVNWLWNSEAVSTLFHNLVKETTISNDFPYAGLIEALTDYHRKPCNKWIANFKQNYCNTPWAPLSIVAAVLLLLLTFIQAVCSIIALM